MKPDAHRQIERFRVKEGRLASDASYGNNGAFMVNVYRHHQGGLRILEPDSIPASILTGNTKPYTLGIVVSDGAGWDHVSVSLQSRCPTWQEMSFVKDLFFEPHEAAMQLHPPQSEYVNHHEYCLHIWRPHDKRIPLPPSEFVGPR